MQNEYINICENLSELICLASETVWLFRQQYFFRASQKLNAIIMQLQTQLEQIVNLAGEEYIEYLGIAFLLDAQELNDEILIADILETQLVPSLENLVQQLQNQLNVQDINFWNENLEILRTRGNSELVHILESAKARENCSYSIEYTAVGQVTIKLNEGGKQYYISGNNNPYKDAISFVHGNMVAEKYQYIIFGAGMFYEAEILLKYRPDAKVIVVEEDPYLLKLAFKYRDMRVFLESEQLSIIYNNYDTFIKSAEIEECCVWWRKPALKHIQDEQIRLAMERFFLQTMTLREQAYVLETQFRKNITKDKTIRSIDECHLKFLGRTVYLIAGGPSLDWSMHLLKNREPNSLILCVGTSVAKLKKENIIPEFVIITDVADTIYHQINGNLDEEKTSLLYMCSANAKAVDSFSGDKYAIFQYGFDMAEEYAKEKKYTLFSTGGSVATTALDICIRFGCKKVICMGLDFAYTNNSSHASNTSGYKKIVDDKNAIMVKGVAGDQIPTKMNLSTYHYWVENRIRDVRDCEFVNISNGAYIHGMKNVLAKKD